MQELTDLMKEIGEEPLIRITPINNLEYKIEIMGELMKSYMMLGDVQEKIKNEVGKKFELKTIYGDGQDAILKFQPIE